MSHAEVLTLAFKDCQKRGCSKAQLVSFINRARDYWSGNPGMTVVVESMQKELEGTK